ncbi:MULTISPECIES: hemerythrin domain-containing protein [Mycobacterium]|uniref:Hemerythrin domain-containing protein n=1 Tax=Mycobacterium colombiense TaxID=339268 RepID=A0A329LCF9_9MYCO|nr:MULTISPECIES: hemerythrin domain-containing protein [Mycobacterium]MDM4141668.1 hemerythrin domain-containing protein [Mycobacterium sp. FLAC0960]RAV05735.1 hemerythrin domain-containing protein [Mycobacterium colombiense]
MNAYEVLFEHHRVLRGLCAKITEMPADSDERQDALDELLIELDIHMRIEDDLFYPAVSEASTLVAIAHAEHRQVWDQLAVLLRTSPTAPEYADEWRSFVTVLDAHASEEERDLCPAPIDLSEDMLDALGNRMVERITRLHRSPINRFRVRSRKALLSSLGR